MREQSNQLEIRLLALVASLILFIANPVAHAKVVEYNFDIDYKTVNFSGKNVRAMAVGGSIPAPTIEATVGDTLRVTFNNKMNVPSSIHWHGVLLPQDQDGVPFLTMKPIAPGTSFTYEYPVKHHGTYWYHSHTGLQEQRGVYGSIVFHPENGEAIPADHELVVVLSDWTDENPDRVMHNLKKSDDYYALKKDSVQSWLKVLQHGKQAIKNRLNGAWIRMGPMDISDVGYDAFLLNGEKSQLQPEFRPGDTVRLRVINAAASSYFFFEYAGGPMQIVAADGVDVTPVNVDRQRIAIAETFDVIVKIPEDGAYEFRATSEDGTGYSSLLLGSGKTFSAPDMPKPNPFLVDHSTHATHHSEHTDNDQMKNHAEQAVKQPAMSSMADNHGEHSNHQQHTQHMNHQGHIPQVDHSQHQGMDHSSHQPTEKASPQTAQRMTEYELLRSEQPTSFNSSNPKREVLLKLTGDMERYAWSFNNKVLSEKSNILIKRGETVQFILDNRTMMHHPIHLHGHFFRVLNGAGKYSPLKHTVNVPPMDKVVIEFYANEEKDWLFHCHNLYHMKSGMTRIVSYQETTQTTRKSLAPMFADQHWYHFADLGLQNNFAHAELRTENTRNAFNLEIEHGVDSDEKDDYEIELVYERYINRFLELYLGGEVEKEVEDGRSEKEELGIIGAHYLLPLLIDADIRLDSEGDMRLALSSELQLTDRLAFEWDINTDDEYHLQLEYELSKAVVITGGWDDHYDWGAGLEFRY